MPHRKMMGALTLSPELIKFYARFFFSPRVLPRFHSITLRGREGGQGGI